MSSFSFKNSNNDPTRYSLDKYYMLLLDIKNFNTLIENKTASKKQITSVWRTLGNVNKRWVRKGKLLYVTFISYSHFSYHPDYYKFLALIYQVKKNSNISQKTNFTEKLNEDDG